jgi:hypothetical protein
MTRIDALRLDQSTSLPCRIDHRLLPRHRNRIIPFTEQIMHRDDLPQRRGGLRIKRHSRLGEELRVPVFGFRGGEVVVEDVRCVVGVEDFALHIASGRDDLK